MAIAALIAWVITAHGGFVLLGRWLQAGGQKPGASRLPAPVVFGHFLLAAAGLVLWIIYVVTDNDTLAWVAVAMLVLIALLGFTLLFRWLPSNATRRPLAPGRVPTGASRFLWSAPTASSPSPRLSWSCSPRSGSARAETSGSETSDRDPRSAPAGRCSRAPNVEAAPLYSRARRAAWVRSLTCSLSRIRDT
jgi:hypothetical protein